LDLSISPKQVAIAGEQYARLKPTIEVKYPGQFIVIDPVSKEYWVSPFLADAFRMAKLRFPDRLFQSFKIGEETTLRMS
jgi:hypothetical protein